LLPAKFAGLKIYYKRGTGALFNEALSVVQQIEVAGKKRYGSNLFDAGKVQDYIQLKK
jgi:hypothetical protein